MPRHFEVTLETHFCAAHALRDYKGTTEPVHGHNFKVFVTVRGDTVDQAGMLVDFLELKPIVDSEAARFHYGFVNEAVEEFRLDGGALSPSAELLAKVLFERIEKRLPSSVRMRKVEVSESPGCTATYGDF